MKRKNTLLFLLCLTVAVLSHNTSIEAKEAYRQVRKLSSNLTHEKDRANVLQADWTYMTRSERLDKLASKHLSLTTIKPKQIVRFSDVLNMVDFADMGFSYKVAFASPKKKPKDI
jgi:hypothetical protein